MSNAIPELTFYDIGSISINYDGKELTEYYDKDSLVSIRKTVIEAALELGIRPGTIAIWMERCYRVYLDHGGSKVR